MQEADFNMDAQTARLEALLLHIAQQAATQGKAYYLGGGFAVDLTFGGVSRAHEDVDFYPHEADTEWWKTWFRSEGYVVSQDSDMRDLPNAFAVLGADGDYLADVYPVEVDTEGGISMLVAAGTQVVWDGMLTIMGTRGVWAGKSWRTVRRVLYKGQEIALEDYRTVLAQKEAYCRLTGATLSAKHVHDFERAGVQPKV